MMAVKTLIMLAIFIMTSNSNNTLQRLIGSCIESCSKRFVKDTTDEHDKYYMLKSMLQRQKTYDQSGLNKKDRGNDIDVSLHRDLCLCTRCLEYTRFVQSHPKGCKICKGMVADTAASSQSPSFTDPLILNSKRD